MEWLLAKGLISYGGRRHVSRCESFLCKKNGFKHMAKDEKDLALRWKNYHNK